MRPKFGKSSIFIRDIMITSILSGFGQKNKFFEECSCFKFENLRLSLDTSLKVHTGGQKT